MKKILLLLFFLLSVINLCAEYLGNSLLIFTTKPLLLSLLSIYFFISRNHLPTPFKKYILAGLVFSIAGDTFLMFVENSTGYEHFFLFGLGSFLFTHICYLVGFLSFPGTIKGWVSDRPWTILFFAAYLVGNCIFLWSDLPADLKIPVVVYSTAIIAMTAAALNLKGKIPTLAFQILITGVILFVCSDSIIALNKFKSSQLSLPYPRLLIMITYLLGQYLIVQGCLKTTLTSKIN